MLIFPAVKWTNDPYVQSWEELRYKCRDCDKAKQLAYEDSRQNKFRIIFWGLPNERSITAELIPILKERFNIQSLSGGCVELRNIECYNQQMKELLPLKFGKAALDQAYLEAKQRYESKKASQ
jgi:hypothetical protein